MANDFAQVIKELVATEKQVVQIRQQAERKAEEQLREARESAQAQLLAKATAADAPPEVSKELQDKIVHIEKQGKSYRAELTAAARQKIASAVAEAVKIVVPAP